MSNATAIKIENDNNEIQPSIGDILKQRRLSLGLSLEAVMDTIKIRMVYLQAIEDNNFHLIPGPVYVAGFLKNYATYLKLSPDAILTLYANQSSLNSQNIAAYKTYDLSRKKRFLEAKSIFISLCLITLTLGFWHFGSVEESYHYISQAAFNQWKPDDFKTDLKHDTPHVTTENPMSFSFNDTDDADTDDANDVFDTEDLFFYEEIEEDDPLLDDHMALVDLLDTEDHNDMFTMNQPIVDEE